MHHRVNITNVASTQKKKDLLWMDQVVVEGSVLRSMKNRRSVYLNEFIEIKHVEPDFSKKYIKKLSKREQTEQEHHKKRLDYLFQVQNKEFMSKNHGESLLGCPV